MKTSKHKKVVWFYGGDHSRHPFICLAAKSLVESGYTVSVLDLAPQRVDTCYQHIPITFRLPGSIRYGYSIVVLLVALRHILAKRPGIIIATLPMPASAGWLAAKLVGSRLVYYPFELYGEQNARVPTFWRKMEILILSKGINALITQNEERARIYIYERRARVAPTIVHNYKERQNANRSGKLRGFLKLSSEYRIVLYEGILHRGRCLDRLVQAAVYLPEDTRLVLMGEKKLSWWTPVLEPMLDDPTIARKVLVAPWVPHAELLEYVADADVGVIIYDNNSRNNFYCEPGKLSDYVFAGVPIAASNFPTLGPVIHRYGIGETFASTEPEEIARAINAVLSVPRATWQPGLERAREDLAWETQMTAFLKAVSGEQGTR